MSSCGKHGYDGRTLVQSVIAKKDKVRAECEQVMTLGNWTLENIAFLRNKALYMHVYNEDQTFNAEESYNQTVNKINELETTIKTSSQFYYKPVSKLRTLNQMPMVDDPEYHKQIIKDARILRRSIEKDFKEYNVILQALPLDSIELLDPQVLIGTLDTIIDIRQPIIKTHKESVLK